MPHRCPIGLVVIALSRAVCPCVRPSFVPSMECKFVIAQNCLMQVCHRAILLMIIWILIAILLFVCNTDAKISDLRAAAVASAAALSAASGHPMFLSGSATTGT